MTTLNYETPLMSGGYSARRTLADKYLTILGLVLLGYAVGGRGFAYMGIKPLYIGEVTFMIGILAFLNCRALSRVFQVRQVSWLIAFIVWGVVCTAPYMQKYGMEAVRDSVLYIYSAFAIILAAVLIENPMRFRRLFDAYSKFAILFLLIAPFTVIATRFFEAKLPVLPGAIAPIVQTKGGDVCVHVAGVYCYVVAIAGTLNPWLSALLIAINAGLNVQGRAAILSFMSAAVFCVALKPTSPRAGRVWMILGLCLFLFWATGIELQKETSARPISFDSLVESMLSVVGKGDEHDRARDGSKEWRMDWWADIIKRCMLNQPSGALERGGVEKLFFGDGYGVNLATLYDKQVEADDLLRSPHNGHLTVLARGGIPQFAVYAIMQVSWIATITTNYFLARRRKDWKWTGVFMFLAGYWLAFMVNTTFDVYIEGPMGGIWMWNLYGFGLAAIYIYKKHPEVLYVEVPKGSRGRLVPPPYIPYGAPLNQRVA